MKTEQQLILEIEQDIENLKSWNPGLESLVAYFNYSIINDEEKIISEFHENSSIFLEFYQDFKTIIQRLQQNIDTLSLYYEEPFIHNYEP